MVIYCRRMYRCHGYWSTTTLLCNHFCWNYGSEYFQFISMFILNYEDNGIQMNIVTVLTSIIRWSLTVKTNQACTVWSPYFACETLRVKTCHCSIRKIEVPQGLPYWDHRRGSHIYYLRKGNHTCVKYTAQHLWNYTNMLVSFLTPIHIKYLP